MKTANNLAICFKFLMFNRLIEITMNHWTAWFFGILFIVIGILVGWSYFALQIYDKSIGKLFCAALIAASGVACFLVDSSWFHTASYYHKLCMYAVLGMALSFACTFTIMDTGAYLRSFVQSSYRYEQIRETKEVTFVIFMAIMMGCCFGWVFANIPSDPSKPRMALLREEEHCYPIGVFLGGATGVGYSILTTDMKANSTGEPTYQGIGEANAATYDFDLDDDI
jgi:hypothetical protein